MISLKMTSVKPVKKMCTKLADPPAPLSLPAHPFSPLFPFDVVVELGDQKGLWSWQGVDKIVEKELNIIFNG